MTNKKLILSFLLTLITSISIAQNIQNLNVEHNAIRNNQQCYTITPEDLWTVGAVWSETKVPINQDFKYQFKLNFGNKAEPLGADGLTFIFALENEIKDTAAGQFLGVKDISPSIHLEFDVFQNIIGSFDFNDPDVSHIAFFKDGNGKHKDVNCLSKTGSNDGWIQLHATQTNVQDGQWYDIELIYDATANLLSVYVDNSFRHSIAIDIANDIFSGETEAYWGITGSTGGVSNIQQVCFEWDTTQAVESKKYVMPNAFVPSSSGTNSTFKIVPGNGYKIGTTWIYNRWGKLVYEGLEPWDGRYNSEIVPQGVYVVTSELISDDGEITKIIGDVTVIK